jgi:hypothetical protein
MAPGVIRPPSKNNPRIVLAVSPGRWPGDGPGQYRPPAVQGADPALDAILRAGGGGTSASAAPRSNDPVAY